MRGVLCQIQPWDRATAARVTINVGSAINSQTKGLSGVVWENAITRRPRFTMELFDPDLSGRIMTGRGDLTLNVEMITGVANAKALDWEGAPITIWTGDGPTITDMVTEFVGKVVSGRPDLNGGAMTIAFEVDRKLVDVPLLNIEYGGGGGADGEPEIRGQLKPAGFGSPKNVPPVLIDSVNNVYQVDGYGNLTSISGVFEDLASMGATFGNYATYAALVAADVPEGRWATCIAEGMFKLGAPPTGVITCDPVCGTNRPGAMMLRWLQTHAGVSAPRIRTSDFTALDAAVNRAVSFWTNSQTNVLDMLQRMSASCNAVPLIMLDGQIGVTRVFGGALAVTLQRFGGDPICTDWQTMERPTPWWRVKMMANRVYRTHSPAEIDYEDDLIDRGDYVAGETYRQGHIVRQPTNGIRYLYTNATPTAGNAPPNGAYWAIYEAAPTSASLKYADGTPIEALKPGQAGADVTASNVASGIAGQGSGATANTLVQLELAAGQKLLGIEQGATASDNLIRNATLQDGTVGYAFISTAARFTGAFGDPSYYFRWTEADGITANDGQRTPVNPGETLFCSMLAWTNIAGTTTRRVRYRLGFYDAAGIQVDGYTNVYFMPPSAATWYFKEDKIVVPAGAATMEIVILQDVDAGSVRASAFRIARSSSGADVTAVNTALSIFGQGTGATANDLAGLNSAEGLKLTGIAPGATKDDLRGLAMTAGAVNFNPNLEARAPDGRPAGWYAAYGQSDPSTVKFEAATGETVLELSAPADVTTGVASAAFRVDGQTQYDLVLTLRGESASASGLYVRIQEYDSSLPKTGKFIADLDGEAGRVTPTRTIALAGDIPVPGVATLYTYAYKPTATAKWASILILNWTGHGAKKLFIERALLFNRATFGADLGSNIIDSGDPLNPNSPVPRGEIRTPLGTALAVLGQGALATKDDADFALDVIGVGKPAKWANADENLIFNSSLLEGNDGWSLPGSVVRLASSAAASPDAFLRWSQAAGNADAYPNRHDLSDNYFPCDEGEKFFVSAYTKALMSGGYVARAFRIWLTFYDGAGTIIVPSVSIDIMPPNTSGWHQKSGQATAPVGSAKFRVLVRATDVGASEWLYATHIRVARMEAGSDITGSNTASGIVGQGTLATRGFVYFGSSFLLETDGGATATISAFKTSQGTAAGIDSQGALATRGDVYFGSSFIRETSGGTNATLANFKTSSGTANAILNQGNLATKNSVDLATSEVTNKSLANLDPTKNNELAAATLAIADAASDGKLTPTEKKEIRRRVAEIDADFRGIVPIAIAVGYPVGSDNELPSSDDLSTSWTALNLTRTANAAPDPEGNANSAPKYVGTAVSSNHRISAAFNGDAGPQFESFAVRIVSGYTHVILGTNTTTGVVVFEHLSGKVVANTLVGFLSAGSVPIGNGYRRYWISYWGTANAAVGAELYLSDRANAATSSTFAGGEASVVRAQAGEGYIVAPPYRSTTTANSTQPVGAPLADGAAAARFAVYEALFRVTPSWEDDSVTSLNWPADNLLGEPIDLTVSPWGTSNTSVTRSGAEFVIADTSATLVGFFSQSKAAEKNRVYTVAARIKKDAVGRATRHVALMLTSTGGSGTREFTLYVDTATGENAVRPAGGTVQTPLESGVFSDGDYWLAYVTGDLTDQATALARFYPSWGVNFGGPQVGGTSSATIRDMQLFIGRPAERAKASLTQRIIDYANAVKALRKIVQDRWNNRTQKLTDYGRIQNGQALNSSNNFGLRSLADTATLSDTPAGGTITINIGAMTYYTDWGAVITFPSGTIPGLAYNTKYYLFRNQSDPAGTGESWGYSTTLTDALGTGKVYIGKWTTRATSGSPAPPPPPPPPTEDCVAVEALVPTIAGVLEASRIMAGDTLLVLDVGMNALAREQCESNHVGENDVVQMETESGVMLTLSHNTPITLYDGGYVIAANATGYRVPVLEGDDVRWERVVAVRPKGRRRVSHIKCNQATYAAGDAPGRYILTHNPLHKP